MERAHNLFNLKSMLLIGSLLLSACSASQGDGYRIYAKDVIDDSIDQLRHVLYQSSMGSELGEDLKTSQGVLIFPSFAGAGLGVIGGVGGKGVMLVRGANNEWSYPIFVNTGGVSLGLVIGGYAGSLIMVLRSSEDVNAILDNRFHFDMEVAAAGGNTGKYLAQSLSAPSNKSIKGYGVLSGLYLGASFDFSGVTLADDLTHDYYKGFRDDGVKILRQGLAKNPHADPLRAELGKFSRP